MKAGGRRAVDGGAAVILGVGARESTEGAPLGRGICRDAARESGKWHRAARVGQTPAVAAECRWAIGRPGERAAGAGYLVGSSGVGGRGRGGAGKVGPWR